MKLKCNTVLSLLLKSCVFFVSVFLLHSCIGEKEECEGFEDRTEEDVAYFTVSVIFSDEDKKSENTRAQFDGTENTYDSGYFFNYGVDEESDICSDAGANWLLAYDENGQSIISLPLVSFTSVKPGDGNSSRSYKAVCQVNPETLDLTRVKNLKIILNAGEQLQNAIRQGENPDAIILAQTERGNNDYLFLKSKNADGFRRYHTMSSSVIVNNGRAETAVNIDEFKYYPTPEQALERPCATLYVERMQTKYTVLFRPDTYAGPEQYFLSSEVWNYNPSTQQTEKSADNVIVFSPSSSRRVYYVNSFNVGDDMPTVNRGYWKASITGWNVNATEPSEYLFKSFGSSPGTFASWNFTPWGQRTPVRNLWAVDPNYSGGKEAYPDQYRHALDISTAEGVTAMYPYEGYEESTTYPLNYLSFRALSGRDIRQFTSENTYDAVNVFGNKQERLEDRLQYRCGNHIVVGAQLLIEGMDAAGVYNPTNPTTVDNEGLVVSGSDRVKSKYFMNNIYWTEDAYINYYCKYLANNIDATTECKSDLTIGHSFVPNNVFTPAYGEAKFYVQEGGTFRLANSEDFEIKPVYIIGGDGWCYPFPKREAPNSNNTVLKVKQANGAIHTVTVEEYDKLAYGYPFYFAKGFTEGRMYYAVPVSSNTSRESANNFGLVTGDYGAVRNHWYHYRFTELTSVGVPVHNPDQPIVPNREPSLLGLGFEVRIIPWHVVEEDVKI